MWTIDEKAQPSGPALIYSRNGSDWDSVSWNEFIQSVNDRAASAAPLRGCKVGLVMRPRPHELAWLLALCNAGATTVLLPARANAESIAETAAGLALEWLIDSQCTKLTDSARNPERTGEARIVILTSGTSGRQKAVVHCWESITRPVRRTPSLAGSRWLLTFEPHLYAGIQVMLHALLNSGTLVMLPRNWSPESVMEAIARFGVSYCSATPSFWRYVLLSTSPAQWRACSLAQITLGGETAGQHLLHRLRSAFPSARIVHIYATTELGRCFSVADCREGFPQRLLEARTEEGIELKIENGELLVRSANAMIGYVSASFGNRPSSDWIHTGDLVEVSAGRVLFRGRTSDLANVGGHKVSPAAVEEFLRGLPEVADALVYSVPSVLAGQLLAADLVLQPGADVRAARSAIRKCATALPPPQRPRMWNIVERVALSPAGKRIRCRPQ